MFLGCPYVCVRVCTFQPGHRHSLTVLLLTSSLSLCHCCFFLLSFINLWLSWTFDSACCIFIAIFPHCPLHFAVGHSVVGGI